MAIEPSSYGKDWNKFFSAETGRSLSKHLREVSEPDNVFPVLVIHQDHGGCTGPLNQNFGMEQKFPGEVLETVEFAKCEPFKGKFLKFREKS